MNSEQNMKTPFGRPLPYGVGILRFEYFGPGKIKITRESFGGMPERSAIISTAQARYYADKADAEAQEIYDACKGDPRIALYPDEQPIVDGGFGYD